MDSAIQVVHKARKNIEQVRHCLLAPTPESIEACTEQLEVAIGCMERLEGVLLTQRPLDRATAPSLRAEVDRLRTELSRVSALLASASAFHEGMARLLRPEPAEEIDYRGWSGARHSPVERRFTVHG